MDKKELLHHLKSFGDDLLIESQLKRRKITERDVSILALDYIKRFRKNQIKSKRMEKAADGVKIINRNKKIFHNVMRPDFSL